MSDKCKRDGCKKEGIEIAGYAGYCSHYCRDTDELDLYLDKLARYLINEALVETDDIPQEFIVDEAIKVIQKLKQQNQWISVSEPPEVIEEMDGHWSESVQVYDNEYDFLYCDGDRVTKSIFHAQYGFDKVDPNKFYWVDKEGNRMRPTFWKQLPLPPISEES